jgi:hypothetical protein
MTRPDLLTVVLIVVGVIALSRVGQGIAEGFRRGSSEESAQPWGPAVGPRMGSCSSGSAATFRRRRSKTEATCTSAACS